MTLRLDALSGGWTGVSGMLEGLRPNGDCCWRWVLAKSLSIGSELVGDPGGVGLTRGEDTGVGGGEVFCGIEASAWSQLTPKESSRTRALGKGE